MTSDQSPTSGPAGPAGSRGRQRPAPTIDLKATEIASEPTTEPAAAEPEAAAAGAASHASADAAIEASAMDASGGASAEPGSEATLEQRTAANAQAESAEPEPTASPRPRWRFSRPAAGVARTFPWRWIGAGAAGAALMLAGFMAASVFSGGSERKAARALEARLARVETQVRALAARPSTPTVDPKAMSELAARVGKLETAIATPRPPATVDPALDNRIATLEGTVSALDERIGVVARRTDDIAATANETRARADAVAVSVTELQKAVRTAPPPAAKNDLDALANRVAALEKTAKALEAAIAKRAAGITDDRAVRLGVAAALLKAAVERGDPITAELSTAKSLAPDAKALAPLDSFAATGVPSAAALARELAALMPRLVAAAGTAPRERGFFDRLQAHAEGLVRVRRIGAAAGNSTDAILSRIEARAAQADLGGALAELAKLPASVRAPADAWIVKAQTREAAVNASRRFAADALATLAQPTP
jgi:hypothetical protein